MSLTSWLKGRTKGVEEFAQIIKSATPSRSEFKSLSGNNQSEYAMLVPYGLTNHNFAGFVGTTFDYLARFRIARIVKDEKATESLVAARGFQRLLINLTNKAELKPEQYNLMLAPVLDYINGVSEDRIENLIPITCRLAYLEDIARGSLELDKIKIQNVLNGKPKEEVRNELKGLLSVFEEKFITSEIINENSEVIYNPHFGISGALVDGADADLFIDGTLYDFKTSKNNSNSLIDYAQLIGYYFLNELAMKVDSISFSFPYDDMDIKRLAIYKARFGEIEYYDLTNISNTMKRDIVQKMAAYFIGKTVKLGLVFGIDIDELNRALEILKDEEKLSETDV